MSLNFFYERFRIFDLDNKLIIIFMVERNDDGFFRVRTGRTSNPERAYLRAMAELGPGAVRSAEVAAALGRPTSALGPTRDGLIKKALCYSPRWGEIDFTVPMFDGIMKRWIPDFESVL